MGFGGISPWSLVLILVIVLLLFGTKKLRSLGSDLGGALKGFKKAMSDDPKSDDPKSDDLKQLDDDEASAAGTSETKTQNQARSTVKNTSDSK